ncbi:MAG TPA: ATP-dependent DNA helicase PcrA, partial [Candidatus Moranbacteria bacterium]|nr:ATP-dependent DNA helicase PcrA [Candidatus Moranbacteria bacterium]
FLAETREKAAKLSLPEIIFDIYENSGYKRAVFENEDNFAAQSREDNIKELAASVSARREPALSSLAEFLERTALVSDTDELDRGEEAVRLMTLHSAKGLEFPVVFIVGLEEGLLPHSRSQTSAADLEEERRLMYVGMTRAMDKLYLVHARARTVFGSRQRNSPSRFLADLPEENCLFLERNRPESRFSQVFSDEGISSRKLRKSSSSESTSFSDGETVKHPLFGSGMIVAQDEHAYTIAFADGGIKKIAKAFEGLKKA